MEAGVDDLMTRIAKSSGNDFGTPVVAIETGFCYEDSPGHTGDEG